MHSAAKYALHLAPWREAFDASLAGVAEVVRVVLMREKPEAEVKRVFNIVRKININILQI